MSIIRSLLRFIMGEPKPAAARAAATPRASVTSAEPAARPAERSASEAEPESETSILARSEVLGRDRALLGYAFSLHDAAAGKVRVDTARTRGLLDEVLVGTLLDKAGELLAKRTTYLPVWTGFVLNPLAQRLVGTRAMLVLRPEAPDTTPAPELLAAAAALRAAGLELALENHLGSPWFKALVPLAGALVIDSKSGSPADLQVLSSRLKVECPGLQWLAWNVDTEEDFEHLKRLGCVAFQGGFVTHREDWSGNRLAPHSLRVARLINQLRDDTGTREIAEVLKHDMALTYRLLRYVNAVAWGINNPISSIEHALVVLGNYPLRRWLALLLFGSARNNAAANALMDLALTRARLMELLGKARLSREECEQLFMLGMFSLIDVIMQVPLERALSPLKLQQPVADALLSGSGPLADYLALAQAVERGDEARLADTSERLGVAAGELNRLQFEALLWVQAGSGAESPAP